MLCGLFAFFSPSLRRLLVIGLRSFGLREPSPGAQLSSRLPFCSNLCFRGLAIDFHRPWAVTVCWRLRLFDACSPIRPLGQRPDLQFRHIPPLPGWVTATATRGYRLALALCSCSYCAISSRPASLLTYPARVSETHNALVGMPSDVIPAQIIWYCRPRTSTELTQSLREVRSTLWLLSSRQCCPPRVAFPQPSSPRLCQSDAH